MAIPQGILNAGGGSTCWNGSLPKTKGVGQHSGIYTANITKWVGQHAGTRSKTQKKIGLGVGQHAGIVGQHEQEWWVNMGRNLQLVQYYRFFYLYYLKYSLKNADPHRSTFR